MVWNVNLAEVGKPCPRHMHLSHPFISSPPLPLRPFSFFFFLLNKIDIWLALKEFILSSGSIGVPGEIMMINACSLRQGRASEGPPLGGEGKRETLRQKDPARPWKRLQESQVQRHQGGEQTNVF